MTALLEIENLHTEIRLRRSVVHALAGVSLTVEAGECLGIVGESGCGKTMTALSIMRLLPGGGHITAGRITVDGTNITALPEDKMQDVRGNLVGMVFQDPLTSLNPTKTIGDQIAESVRLHRGAGRRAALDRAVRGARAGRHAPPRRAGSQLPAPAVRRHAAAGDDRHGAGLRAQAADRRRADHRAGRHDRQADPGADRRPARRLGMAVILVTHDLGVIAGRADRVAVMYAGRVVETAATTALFAAPRHPYTEALFEALPENAGPAVRRLYNIPGQPPDLTAPPPGCRFAPRCRYARDTCRDGEPDLTGSTTGHQFRCFFPVTEQAARRGRLQPRRGGGHRHPIRSRRRGGPAAAEQSELLRLDHLVKDFPVTAGALLQRRIGTVSAVADVSFTTPAGQTFGLVGESGCGKTTIGRLIVGLEHATSGRVLFGGEDLTRLSGRERRRRSRDIQIMFQDSYASMDPRMRVGTILREPLVIQRQGNRASQQRLVADILGEVGLPAAAADRYPHEFSGGQRQRLGLARALVLRPAMIVADEPVSALDVSIQAQILNLMKDLQASHGLTYLFISHDLSVSATWPISSA